jgi:hypothetical protein
MYYGIWPQSPSAVGLPCPSWQRRFRERARRREAPANCASRICSPLRRHQGQSPTPAFEKTLLALAGEVGAVLADFPEGQAAGCGQRSKIFVRFPDAAASSVTPASLDACKSVCELRSRLAAVLRT